MPVTYFVFFILLKWISLEQNIRSNYIYTYIYIYKLRFFCFHWQLLITIVILITAWHLCVIYMFLKILRHQPQGFLFWLWKRKQFNVCNDFSAHEGKTDTEESAQVLTVKNWQIVLHPAPVSVTSRCWTLDIGLTKNSFNFTLNNYCPEHGLSFTKKHSAKACLCWRYFTSLVVQSCLVKWPKLTAQCIWLASWFMMSAGCWSFYV